MDFIRHRVYNVITVRGTENPINRERVMKNENNETMRI